MRYRREHDVAFPGYHLFIPEGLEGENAHPGQCAANWLATIEQAIAAIAGVDNLRQPSPRPVVTERSADAELIALEAEIMEAVRYAEVAGTDITRAEEAMFEWKRQHPRPQEDADVAQWEEEKAAARVECQYAERDANWTDSVDELCDLADKVAAIPAMTMSGIEIKSRLVQYQSEVVMIDHDDEIAASIPRDLLRIRAVS
jgi:hypothetical protein